ncbi:hypothetical protein FIG92_11940 [Salmonella enterica subsp. enterica]|nr:hypothetical protein [Salmonella enterica subsp. enterica serovar Ank]EBH2789588.1 hypothetical protein [Salmonella enterica subsp. enterica serovar Ank]
MDALTDIGEMVISTRDDDYFLRPSFIAMTRIGSPDEIVAAYTTLNGGDAAGMFSGALEVFGEVPAWMVASVAPAVSRRMVDAAMTVIQACCNRDVAPLVGELKGWGTYTVVRRRGLMRDDELLVIARALLAHGVMGKAPLRQLQKNESRQAFTSGFRAVDYITAARSHFGISRDEAEQLTMTAFQLMLKAKYPEEKGFTRDEYDDIMAQHEKRKQQRINNPA